VHNDASRAGARDVGSVNPSPSSPLPLITWTQSEAITDKPGRIAQEAFDPFP